MQFDPAIAAQRAFARATQSGELGPDEDRAREAEEIFSGSAGADAKAAYYALIALGERHPDAVAFQEFLIYITWQQVTEDTIAEHFERGATLCDRYLHRPADGRDPLESEQIRDLRRSYRAGLGQTHDDETDYDADTLTGGD